MKIFPAIALIAITIACSETASTQEASEPVEEAMVVEQDEAAAVEAGGGDEELSLDANGYGRLRIGMTRDEAIAAYGGPDEGRPSGLPEPEICDEFHPARAPDGLYVMIEQGVLVRITLADTRDIGTDRGILVGDPASKVREIYGDRVDARPHTYLEPPAEYLDVWEGDLRPGPEGDPEGLRGIRYETDENGNVEAIHAGDSSIQYVEGCL